MWENKILGAMLTLNTFTARDLADFADAKIATVRDLIKRLNHNQSLIVKESRPTGHRGRNERVYTLTEAAAAEIAERLRGVFESVNEALTAARPDSVNTDDRDIGLRAAADLIDEAILDGGLDDAARASLLDMADIELSALEDALLRRDVGAASSWSDAIAAVRSKWTAANLPVPLFAGADGEAASPAEANGAAPPAASDPENMQVPPYRPPTPLQAITGHLFETGWLLCQRSRFDLPNFRYSYKTSSAYLSELQSPEPDID